MLPLLWFERPIRTIVLGLSVRFKCTILVRVRVDLTVGTTFLAWYSSENVVTVLLLAIGLHLV